MQLFDLFDRPIHKVPIETKDEKNKMSVIELQTTYDITGPKGVTVSSLCSSCEIKGKSFLCLVINKNQYPDTVAECDEYKPQN